MLIITGMPRSGTSWVMQTLFLLRYPVFGIPHPPNRDKAMQVDEKAFWEFPDTLGGDLSILGDSDCAVKVHLRKAIENVTLDPEKNKVILCTRDIEKMSQSQIDWALGSTKERCAKVNSQWYARALKWIGETPYIATDIDVARTDATTKTSSVAAIKEFIGSTQDPLDAINNVAAKVVIK